MTIATKTEGPVVRLPEREIPLPGALSDAARAVLGNAPPGEGPMPSLDDHEAWRRLIAQRNEAAATMRSAWLPRLKANVESREMAGVPVYVGRPQGDRLLGGR